MARQHQPDVVLMDLRMPGAGGLAAIRQLSADQPGARVVVLTTYDSDADILPAVEAGAAGYLLKSAARAEFLDAVGLKEPGLNKLVRAGYELLGLMALGG